MRRRSYINRTSLLARDDGTAMRGLLDAARRIRLTLIALAGLRRQMAPGSLPSPPLSMTCSARWPAFATAS